MAMDPDKLKSADMLTESLKLVVTISTILLGALVAYRSSLGSVTALGSYYFSVGALILCSILCVLNINSLINKIYDGKNDAIKETEVKFLNISSWLALCLGVGVGLWFLSEQQSKPINISDDITSIADSNIVIGSKNQSVIKITKDDSGKIKEVTVSPK